MTKDKALKLALEALEGVLDNSPKVLDASISGGLYEVVQCRDAITALREALAQPEQEPMHPELRKMWEDYFDKCFRAMPLPEYTTPPQRKPLTDEEIFEISNGFVLCMFPVETRTTDRELAFARAIEKAVTRQPQIRPLTDDVMWKLWNAEGNDEMNQQEAIAFARAIEAAHGIKENT